MRFILAKYYAKNTPCFSETSPYNARLAAMYMQR